jgi:hypothetical protein
VLLKKLTEIPKATAGLLLFVAGMALFSLNTAAWVLFVGMFVLTLGEVTAVLGANPYNSRRVPASHRGRIGGLSSVAHAVFSALTQFLISFVLTVSGSNYPLIWGIFIICSLIAAGLYCVVYRADRRTFPLLYIKK